MTTAETISAFSTKEANSNTITQTPRDFISRSFTTPDTTRVIDSTTFQSPWSLSTEKPEITTGNFQNQVVILI